MTYQPPSVTLSIRFDPCDLALIVRGYSKTVSPVDPLRGPGGLVRRLVRAEALRIADEQQFDSEQDFGAALKQLRVFFPRAFAKEVARLKKQEKEQTDANKAKS